MHRENPTASASPGAVFFDGSCRKVSFIDLLEPAVFGVVGSPRYPVEAVIMASIGWTNG
jgi:hypothetical protein